MGVQPKYRENQNVNKVPPDPQLNQEDDLNKKAKSLEPKFVPLPSESPFIYFLPDIKGIRDKMFLLCILSLMPLQA